MKISYILQLAWAELKQVWNNKRFLFLLVVVPIVICVSFGFIAYHKPVDMSTAVLVDRAPGEPVSAAVQKVIDGIDGYTRDDGSRPFAVSVEAESEDAALRSLDEGSLRAVVVLTQGPDGQLSGVKVFCAIGETTITGEIERELGKYFDRQAKEISTQKLAEMFALQGSTPAQAAYEKASQVVYGTETVIRTDAHQNLKYFDFYASAMIAMTAAGMPMLLSAISITSERARGTIERIFVSPFKKSEIIVGKVLAHCVFAVMCVALFIGTLKLVFDVTLNNPALVVLLAILVGINGAVMGLLISSVTRSEAESVMIGMMGLLGIMALMTYLFPWETMHPVARVLSGLLPITYGFQAIRQINMVGAGLADIWLNLAVLAGSIALLTLVSIPLLKRGSV